ncbi:hypothetical protein EMIHUDRAFT_432600 [Emiliania huxleyi CCMP1516]|uniref:Uncharacterized protein n=2 Tax=Emiliania huxleyi TaxID=2903 RepID=A0A0D3IU03_EMIH1|nr:hypothetical protein EMIHUDRAFT_432600 [Emiliania huxleyi CCMP1516]EOD14738.1 hypothetical protein EMIHUDRAFT_432600 [Emiliania huxleyi CCMP1516]|eukprot:XP_005767167.1 hypothetical protein EMIHUDRAFT_432600 [Emiliania huxleyi CCMP1516]
MGDCIRFRQSGVQVACLRFVVDVLNLGSGFLASSRAPADDAARRQLALLRTFADDVTSRCRAKGLGADALASLQRARLQSEGAILADVCDVALASAGEARAERLTADGGAWHRGGQDNWAAGLLGDAAPHAGGLAAQLAGGGEPAPVCRQLRHVYASQSFRQWWLQPSRTRSPDRLQWMEFRAKGIDLSEYVRENRDSLAVLEQSVSQRIHDLLAKASVDGVERAAPQEGDPYRREGLDK